MKPDKPTSRAVRVHNAHSKSTMSLSKKQVKRGKLTAKPATGVLSEG